MTARLSPAAIGSLCAAAAVTCFSINDAAFKFLSGGYALHQVVMIRSLVGIALTTVVLPFIGGLSSLRTARLGAHIWRSLCVVLANLLFFLGLAALPLAEAVAVFFVSPLVITLLSILFLGETVGPRRWIAIVLGLAGVLIVLRPGTAAFQPTALLPLAAALGYAGVHIITRKIRATETATTMVFYTQVTFLVVCTLIGLVLGSGRFAGSADPSLAFLTRAWIWPPMSDWPILIAVGVLLAVGAWCISEAYRKAEAALVAPFEYLAMPLALSWGYLVFGEIPDAVALAGIVLILGSGLFLVWREAVARRRAAMVPSRSGR